MRYQIPPKQACFTSYTGYQTLFTQPDIQEAAC